jgi:hypothetical protein
MVRRGRDHSHALNGVAARHQRGVILECYNDSQAMRSHPVCFSQAHLACLEPGADESKRLLFGIVSSRQGNAHMNYRGPTYERGTSRRTCLQVNDTPRTARSFSQPRTSRETQDSPSGLRRARKLQLISTSCEPSSAQNRSLSLSDTGLSADYTWAPHSVPLTKRRAMIAAEQVSQNAKVQFQLTNASKRHSRCRIAPKPARSQLGVDAPASPL